MSITDEHAQEVEPLDYEPPSHRAGRSAVGILAIRRA
jgi:hypothetical protein